MPRAKSGAAWSEAMHAMEKPHKMQMAIRLETQLSLICGALIGQGWEAKCFGRARGARWAVSGSA